VPVRVAEDPDADRAGHHSVCGHVSRLRASTFK
jgi:hypothetical protein